MISKFFSAFVTFCLLNSFFAVNASSQIDNKNEVEPIIYNNVHLNYEESDELVLSSEDIEKINSVLQLFENSPQVLADYIYSVDQDKYGDESTITNRIVMYDATDGTSSDEIELLSYAGYYACFEKVEWIERNGKWSLSVYPIFKSGGYSKDAAFDFLKEFHLGDSHWNYRNVESMYNQFVCHYDWAGFLKKPWNLEPDTPDKGYWGFVSDKCN